MTKPPPAEPLLTPAEVATLFRVDPKTVTRWAKAGRITSIRTLGGHRRYRESEVRALLAGGPPAIAALPGPEKAPSAPATGVLFGQSPWPAGTAVRWDGGTFRVADRGGVLFLAGNGAGGGFFPLLSDLDRIEPASPS
jgi:excisionase family DNA binding protein